MGGSTILGNTQINKKIPSKKKKGGSKNQPANQPTNQDISRSEALVHPKHWRPQHFHPSIRKTAVTTNGGQAATQAPPCSPLRSTAFASPGLETNPPRPQRRGSRFFWWVSHGVFSPESTLGKEMMKKCRKKMNMNMTDIMATLCNVSSPFSDITNQVLSTLQSATVIEEALWYCLRTSNGMVLDWMSLEVFCWKYTTQLI